MCEAKPGPRCSADAKKTLNKAISSLGNAQTIFNEKAKVLVAASNNYRQFNSERTFASMSLASQEYELANANLEAAKTVKHEKQLEFYATPQGMEALQAESDEYSRITLQAAKAYRELQKTIATHLDSFSSNEDKLQFVNKTRAVLTKEMFQKNHSIMVNHSETENPQVFGDKVSADYLKLLVSDLDDIQKTIVVTR